MSLVIIGGHERMCREYKQICKEYGAKVKVFTHMTSKFNKCIGCPDNIVVFTNTVAHNMVAAAEKEAKRKNIPLTKSHSSSGTALKKIIAEMINEDKDIKCSRCCYSDKKC